MIAVLGSGNMDLVVDLPRIPKPGETVLGRGVRRHPGGKGANQAVAAARLCGDVAFFGKVGADAFGDELLRHLEADGVDVRAVERVAGIPTGLASIWVDEAGENAIAYAPGANASVDADYVDRVFDQLSSADVLLVQFEIPLESIAHLLRRLPKDSPTVIVDPAPAQPLDGLPLERIDILTPNQGELIALAGEQDVGAGARVLRRRGARAVLCKMGDRGASWFGEERVDVGALAVEPVDTTAAGDAFNGALGCVIGDLEIEAAIRWANAAGALATTQRGAQPSLPDREAIQALLRRSGEPPPSKGR
jgi:ribokinase